MSLDFSSVASTGVDATALAADLKRSIKGEVRFDTGSRALYAHDASKYRQVPIGVVVPHDVDDVVTAVELCRGHDAPLLNRGGGTSLAGQCCNVAVVLDFSKHMNNIKEIDAEEAFAVVEPGVVCDDLRLATAPHGLTWAPDPATHKYCTFGGMIGNNSCGPHSLAEGKVEDNVLALEVLTYDGQRFWVGPTEEAELEAIISSGGRRGDIYEALRSLRDRYSDLIRKGFPQIPRRVSGYNLDRLLPENRFDVARALVGTESTCVTVLRAKVRLTAVPPARSLVVLGFPSIHEAADRVPALLDHAPIGLEGFDDRLVDDMQAKRIHPRGLALLPPGQGWLLVEFGGTDEEDVRVKARALIDGIASDPGVAASICMDEREQRQVWEVRESGMGAAAGLPGARARWDGWEDSAVPSERMGDYLRDLRALLDHYGYQGSFYGHFGQGCLHTRISFDLESAAGTKSFRSFMEEAADLVVGYGGSLSGEHGDGQARAELLPRMFGPELVQAFGEFKRIWDPDAKMNPHKIVDPYPLDANLRIGPDLLPSVSPTRFAYPEEGSFDRALLRCVGVGKCRKRDTGTMCPSYMATEEEKHSTRGRARLLFEMAKGDTITEGWRSEEVKDALDLCLSCKACKAECPMGVDMATYKAEFLSHYYAGRLRPRSAYAAGLVQYWARLGSRMPAVANVATGSRALSPWAKRIAGIDPRRNIPALAPGSFRHWFAHRPARPGVRGRLLLWPDTWSNLFHPEVAKAAVDVLEAAGYEVTIPKRSLCCGRPLYDYGMLGLARRSLQRVVKELGTDIQEGMPVIGLEPSCVSVFRDEMPSLLPDDGNAGRLSAQTFLFSEFLEQAGYVPPALHRRALIQGHCHQGSVLGMGAEQAVLGGMGLDYKILDSGCCGMAGGFGFEVGKFEVSQAIGERRLLPAVRAAGDDVLIVANGFSCREQIAQGTDRNPMHLSQVLQTALRGDHFGPPA